MNVMPDSHPIYWPEKGAAIYCYVDGSGYPTVDYYSYYDGVNCCEFDGYLLADGDHGMTPDGLDVQCCKGMLNYVFPYINGSEPEFPGNTGPGTGGGTGGGGGQHSQGHILHSHRIPTTDPMAMEDMALAML